MEQTHALGRRKSAVARVYLSNGKGNITINDRPVENYFALEALRYIVNQPLEVTGTLGQFDIKVTVAGGILRTERRANPQLYMDDAANGRFASQLSFVLAESLPIEVMLNVLRLYDGVPVSLWEEATGLSFDVIGKTVDASCHKTCFECLLLLSG